ncbi:MAG: phage portal protein [Patescibacteria group bacterium]|nr:phage portal protein [Patescibacteria group bacterium]
MDVFINKLLGKVGLVRKSSISTSSSLGGSDPFAIWRGSKKISVEKAMGVYSGWVYTAVRAIAEEIGRIPFHLFQIKKDGSIEELFDHDLLNLLFAPNPHHTGYELKYNTLAHLELGGNSYWLLDGVKNDTDQPRNIYWLSPKYMTVEKGEIPEIVKGYTYRIGSKTTKYQPHEILHIRYPDPNDPFEGIGTVQSIAQWIDADNYATEFNRRFFLNGARIGGFLESENARTPEQLEFLKKSFEEIYKGVENAYKIAALPKGTSYKEGQSKIKDMDFANLQRDSRDKILAGFRVPKTTLGAAESDTNRATAETADFVFAARTIKPKMELLVTFLNERLVPRYGDDIYLDFDNPVPENREQRIKEMEAATGKQPVISINEAREQYFTLPPIENGDAVRGDLMKQPIGEPEKRRKNVVNIKTKNGRTIPKTRFALNLKRRKDASKEIAGCLVDEVKKIGEDAEKIKERAQQGIAELNDEQYEAIWKVFITRISPFEKRQVEALRDFNSKQKDEVLKNLESALKALPAEKAINPDDLFKKGEWVGVLVDLETPILTELYEEEGSAAAEFLGFDDLNILTPANKKALDESVELMAESYNESTLKLLKKKLEEGQREGLPLEELKETVRSVYAFSDEVRAERVARTETFRIANKATKDAWKETEVVKTIKWYTAQDERVDPEICAPLHGKVISIEDNFFNKGDEIELSNGGTFKVDYDDVGSPPIHVSCRCYMRPEEISID